MSVAAPIVTSDTVTYQRSVPAPSTAPASNGDGGLSFGDILSDLNPLQYLPVIGTIYRAVTGDVIPRPLREAGSLVVSGLMGGPIGLATNLAMLALEKLTGIDLEEIEQSVIARLGQGGPAALSDTLQQTAAVEGAGAPSAAISPVTVAAIAPAAGPASETATLVPWSPAQLSAYGIVRRPDGDLQQGALTGADVLNALQLRVGA